MSDNDKYNHPERAYQKVIKECKELIEEQDREYEKMAAKQQSLMVKLSLLIWLSVTGSALIWAYIALFIKSN